MVSHVMGHARVILARNATILLILVALVFVVGATSACDRWPIVTILNKSAVPVDVHLSEKGGGPVMRPGQTARFPVPPIVFPGVYPGGPTVPPPNYPIKAYEFVPGKGNIFGWREEGGTTVTGATGDLIFCVTYTWEELKAMNFTITITRNVFPGYQPPDCAQ